MAGRLVEYDTRMHIFKDHGSLLKSKSYKYEDKTNRLLSYTLQLPSISLKTGFIFGNKTLGQMPDAVYGVSIDDNQKLSYAYDGLGRRTTRTINGTGIQIPARYTYVAGSQANTTTTLVESVDNNGNILHYTYDENNNIIEIKENGTTKATYIYDSLNQLTSETVNGITTAYTYDNGGNILTKTTNGQTTSWLYEDNSWKDLLTNFNGHNITYDAIGNPLNYRNGMTMTWQNGRRLATLQKDNDVISYQYDIEGNRTSKTVNGVTTNYIIDGGSIVSETKNENTILYLFDETGNRFGFRYNGAEYYYILNAQNDVIGILDSNGTEIVTYEYDSWGKLLSISGTEATTIGEINPIRYRGYYYDSETGFYWLQSRYYDPEIGRFINADGFVQTGQGILDKNMFAYCGNNPINRADPSGQFWFLAVIAVVAVGALLTGCSTQPSKPAPVTYSSPDAAAAAFASNIYNSSSYSRHEYGGEIYSKTSGGKTTYYATEARVGSPHSVVVGKRNIPKGTKLEATIHTHPNSNSFSTADMNNAHRRGVNNYVIGPDLNLQRYNISDKTTDIVGAISPTALTDAQRSDLESLRVSWDSHMSGGVCPNGFGCENKTWPNS